MPNGSIKKLTRAIASEKNQQVKLRLLACRLRERGYSTKRICKAPVMPYPTARDG